MTKKDVFATSIIVMFFISGAILTTILFKPLFLLFLNQLDTEALVGLSHHQVSVNYDILMGYLLNPFVSTLQLPNFAMSASGAFHFYEVQRLFLLNNVVFVSSGMITYFIIKTMQRQKRYDVFATMFKKLIWLPVLIVVVLLLGFNFWFVLFHQIAFGNNDWLFNPVTDPIILVLPESFFLGCFVMVFLNIEAYFVTMYVYCRRKMAK